MIFKRNYDRKKNEEYGFNNIKPLGLIYEVYDKDLDYKYPSNPIKDLILKIIGKKLPTQYYLQDLEYNGIHDIDNPKICFTVRLWDGEHNQDLNMKRIKLVELLKSRYGDKFYGGICDSVESRGLYPNLVVDKLYTNRENYLKRKHKCDICIATTGLHNSFGFKFAEYVCAGKVVVSEKPLFYIPEGFLKDKNYFEFNEPKECVKIIDDLLENKNMMIQVSKNNLDYYKRYLKPDMLMQRVIDSVKYGCQI